MPSCRKMPQDALRYAAEHALMMIRRAQEMLRAFDARGSAR